MTCYDKDLLVGGVAQGLAPLIAVALSDGRPVMGESGERAAFRLLEYRGPRVGGEPA